LTRLGRETVEEELWGYLRLEEGWDGSGSVAPSEHAVKNAISFLHRFPDTMMEPTPMVAADGEVGLYWRHKGAYVEIDFAADGMMFVMMCLRIHTKKWKVPSLRYPEYWLNFLWRMPRDAEAD